MHLTVTDRPLKEADSTPMAVNQSVLTPDRQPAPSTSHKTPGRNSTTTKSMAQKSRPKTPKSKICYSHKHSTPCLELEYAAKTMKHKTTSKVSVTAKKPKQIKQKYPVAGQHEPLNMLYKT